MMCLYTKDRMQVLITQVLIVSITIKPQSKYQTWFALFLYENQIKKNNIHNNAIGNMCQETKLLCICIGNSLW